MSDIEIARKAKKQNIRDIARKLDLEEEIVNKMIMDARQKWFA